MKITILDEIKIDKIPSGSGIINSEGNYYIIGDDSPYLFLLDKAFKTISQTPLVDTVNIGGYRIIKSEKPDFEAIEMVGNKEIVIFGSGSKTPERDVFVRILLNDPMIIEKYDISDFYKNLKNIPVFKDSELNVEATAFHNDQIFLFNRKKNLIIRFEYKELLAYLKGEMTFPAPKIQEFSLPLINGIEAGFSGATALNGEAKIIFTASVENTPNAYDDGEILGSFIGMIDISNNSLPDSFNFCRIGSTKTLKVESVTVDKEISNGNTAISLITDDDMGNSTIIKCELFW